jgi:general secretion pathway protein B
MSFILDALKKSENARQRQIGPSLADIPIRRAKHDRPWWAVAVAALLVVNLGVLLVVLLRNRGPDTPTATPVVQAQPAPVRAATPPASQSAPRPATNETLGANPAVHSLAEEASAGAEGYATDAPYDPSVAAAAAVPEGPPVVRSISPPTVTPLPNQATFDARSRTQPDASNEMLPTHGSLIAGGTSLPDMRLDIHVYSAQPAERFVFVNMRKYVEGQPLTEGPTLERITTDGAILNQNGLRFLLPRQ